MFKDEWINCAVSDNQAGDVTLNKIAIATNLSLPVENGKDGKDDKRREDLNFLMRFYIALKYERNATGHADDKTSNHMHYKATRNAILVFVRLCEDLLKTKDD